MFVRLPMRIVSAYWRLTRGATLGAQAVVIGESESVLLVRHGYRPGWHFPGGGVEWRETVETALLRELFEETGVQAIGRPEFHGLFGNFAVLPSDHIAVFIVREWEQPLIRLPNKEIAECRFFPRNELPAGVNAGTVRRLKEIFERAPKQPHW